ncbi:MAG: TRAP transporter permease [Ruminococcaceae bacterium]|nr:TRAP transporter permease [Oscillospiraceae bacterium]
MAKNKEPRLNSRLAQSEIEDTSVSAESKSLLSRVIFVICLIFSLYGIYANSFLLTDALKKAGIFVGFVLLLIFLCYPNKLSKKVPALRYIDYGLAVLGAVSGSYITFILDRLGQTNLKADRFDYVMGVIAMVLVVEATRRCVGNVMAVLPVIFALYALFGSYIPGALGHYGVSFQRFILRMTMTSDGIYGMTTNVASSYIFLFIIFGSLLNKSGVGEFFTDVANKIAGKATGGPAKVAVISSGLMGTISGSAAANVATTGAFTIPMMKKAGFAPAFAGAVEAVASTGGMIMPPIMGSAAFLMANYLSATYSSVMGAAVVPAVLYYLSCFCWVHFMASRLGLRGVERSEQDPLHDFGRRVFLFAPLVVIVVALLTGFTAIFSAFFGMIATVLVSQIQRKRMTLREMLEGLAGGSRGALSALIACIAAGIIVGVCNMTGLGATVTYNIISLSGGHLLFALLLTAVASIILSMGLPATACYIVVATVVAPALVKMGCHPFAAHFFVFYFSCLSNITPPVAIASYTAAGIAEAKPWKVGVQSMVIAAPGFLIPFMFAYQPMLVGQGIVIGQFVLVILTAIVGVVFLAAAGAGHFLVNHPIWLRFIYGVGSLLLIVPETITDVVGVALIVVGVIIELGLRRRRIGVLPEQANSNLKVESPTDAE